MAAGALVALVALLALVGATQGARPSAATLGGGGATGAIPSSIRTPVTSLPGVGDLAAAGIEMTVGYLEAGVPPSGVGTMLFHYWCARSTSLNASEAPVVLWYNGGPGASSLFGLLEELGPLILNEASYDGNYAKSGIPTPRPNPYAWSHIATVCAIDSPPPIGFSYCTDPGPSGPATGCGPWKDSTVFAANRAAHAQFFTKAFPEILVNKNDVFVVGESYGGIYVPGFVKGLMDSPIPGLNLKGFAVGDGVTGCKKSPGRPMDWCVNFENIGLFEYPNSLPGPWYDLEFFHGHSQMSESLYREIVSTCPQDVLKGEAEMTPECDLLVKQMGEEVGYFWPYNVYDACMGPAPDKHGLNRALRARRLAAPIAPRTRGPRPRPITPGDGDGGVGSPCLGTAMPEYLDRADVRKALSLPPDIAFINVDNGVGFSYTTDQGFVGPIYKEAILDKGLRVLVYEGDSDACGLQTAPVEDIFVPYFAEIGLTQTHRWRPWTLGGTTPAGQAGYVIEWAGGQVSFASIRGSGHLAPLNRPHASFMLIKSLLEGGKLPPPYMGPAALGTAGAGKGTKSA